MINAGDGFGNIWRLATGTYGDTRQRFIDIENDLTKLQQYWQGRKAARDAEIESKLPPGNVSVIFGTSVLPNAPPVQAPAERPIPYKNGGIYHAQY